MRLRHTLWRIFAWTLSTGMEGWFLLRHSPLQTEWITLICFFAVAYINWLIVASPVEVYRRVEIRPDCMIIESTDVFWLRLMECGWPTFGSGADGSRHTEPIL